MDSIIDSLQPAKAHRTSKQIGRAIARALDATFVPGAAFTGSITNVATTPPGSAQTKLPSLPLSSYDSIYASVNNNYSPGQIPATLTTPGYQGPTADAEVTAVSAGDNSISSGTNSKALLSGTTLYAVIAGSSALVLIIIIILSVWCWKRKKVKKAEENWYRGKDDSGSRLVSEKPSTTGHNSEGKLSEQEKHWGNSPTSSVPGKNENMEELYRAAGIDSGRDELLGLTGVRKGSRQGYQNNTSYRDTPRSDGHKGSPESTAESSTLAGSPPRKNSNYLPNLPKDQASVPSSRLRYGSIDDSKDQANQHSYSDYSRPSQYQQQNPSPRQSRFEESEGGNYTDFMVRSTTRFSGSSDGRISPLQHDKVSNRKRSIGGRKTDTILDFTDAYSYGNYEEKEEDTDHDGSNWGESKRKRNLSLTNPFVPLPLLLSTSVNSDSFPPPPRTKSSSKSPPPRRVESQNDPRYGRIDSQPLHELESIIDSFSNKPRRESRSTASSVGSPNLRALSLVPKVAPVVRPPPLVVVPAPSFAVSHPTSFNPGFGRSPVSAIPNTPEVPSPVSLPVTLPIRQNSKPSPPSTTLPMGRGRNQPPPITIPVPIVPPTNYSRSRMNSNTSSSSTSSRSPNNYSGSSRSNPSPTSDGSYPTYTQNSSNNIIAGRQPTATIRSDWDSSSSSTSRSLSDTRPSQESLSAMRSRPNPERKGSHGGGSGIGGQGLGGGPIRPQAQAQSVSQDRPLLQNRPSQDRIQYTPPTRMEPVRSYSRPIYNNLPSVPESSSVRNTPPPPAIQGRQAVSRNQVSLSPNQRASMLPPLEGEGGAGQRYRSATMSIYGMYDE